MCKNQSRKEKKKSKKIPSLVWVWIEFDLSVWCLETKFKSFIPLLMASTRKENIIGNRFNVNTNEMINWMVWTKATFISQIIPLSFFLLFIECAGICNLKLLPSPNKIQLNMTFETETKWTIHLNVFNWFISKEFSTVLWLSTFSAIHSNWEVQKYSHFFFSLVFFIKNYNTMTISTTIFNFIARTENNSFRKFSA